MEGKKTKEKKKSMAKKNEKDFLPRKELPFPFEKELLQKQVKNTPAVIKEFIPINDSDNCNPIDGKFHSKFNQISCADAESPDDELKFFKLVEEFNKTPMEKYKFTVLESHRYGWMPSKTKSSPDSLADLNKIYAPKLRSDMTKYGEKLIASKITERSSQNFHGLRFYLS
ncbi:hypothetical protein ACFFRR_002462 [Megaselia abdita]